MNLFVNQAGRAIDDHDITHTHIKPSAQAQTLTVFPYSITSWRLELHPRSP